MPPTLQTLTYSTGAAFLVGRSAAWAVATATMPAAEPSRRLLMSVIYDLQLRIGRRFSFHLRLLRPASGPNVSKAISPLVPFDFLIVALAPAKAADPPR